MKTDSVRISVTTVYIMMGKEMVKVARDIYSRSLDGLKITKLHSRLATSCSTRDNNIKILFIKLTYNTFCYTISTCESSSDNNDPFRLQ